jgi:hypothetical protein
MHDPNYEQSTRLASRSGMDRRAIGLVGDLLLKGVQLERRLTRTLTPRSSSREASSLRAPPRQAVLTGVKQFGPVRKEAA